MSAAHTPGPWFADEAGIVRRGSAGTQSYAEAVPIATPWIEGAWQYEDCTEESKANARLIAAAPELLEACKAHVEWGEAEDSHEGTTFWERVEMYRKADALIRAAIAKATGSKA